MDNHIDIYNLLAGTADDLNMSRGLFEDYVPKCKRAELQAINNGNRKFIREKEMLISGMFNCIISK